METDYSKYSVEELASDELFIDWVQNSSHNTFWQDFIMKHPDSNKTIESAKALIQALNIKLPVAKTEYKKSIWNAVEAHVNSPKKDKTNTIKIISSIAAGIILFVLGYSYINQLNSTSIQSFKGQQVTHVFKDKSSVELNAASTININNYDPSNKRLVELEGEAYFQVEKGNDFIVKTKQGVVSVLGTKFNVKTRPGLFEVACFEGSVKVESPKANNTVILIEGESVKLIGAELVKDNLSITKIKPEWIEGIYIFDNSSVKHVLNELENQYNVEIVANPDIMKKMYTGSFRAGNLDLALQNICWPLRLEYTIEEDIITIK